MGRAQSALRGRQRPSHGAADQLHRLRREGEDLRHCAGAAGYDALCAHEGRHVVGIRRADGARLAAAELRVEGDAPVMVLQVRGPLNREPDAAAMDALGAYVEGLGGGAIPCDRAQLARELAVRRRQRAGPSRGRLDGAGPVIQHAVWAFYRSILPRRWRRVSFDEFEQQSCLFTAMAAEWSERQDPPGAGDDVHADDDARRHDPALREIRARLLGAKAGEDATATAFDAMWRRRPRSARQHPPPSRGDERMDYILAAIRRIIDE